MKQNVFNDQDSLNFMSFTYEITQLRDLNDRIYNCKNRYNVTG